MCEDIAQAWAKAYTSEVSTFSPSFKDVSDAEVFSSVFTHIVHSEHTSDTLLRIERSHAEHARELVSKKDVELKDMTADAPEDSEEVQLCQLKWESELQELRETQRREFRQWVMVVGEQQTGEASGSHTISKSESAFSLSSAGALLAPSIQQESFTITLGAQMKQMHNIRLLAAEPLQLCSYNSSSEAFAEEALLPQRLQTAMSLYSNNLSGMVLLTEDAVASGSGSCKVAKSFVDLCQRSTECHFPSIEQQLAAIREEECLGNAIRWRQEHQRRTDSEKAGSGTGPGTEAEPRRAQKVLQQGDFFVTKHSNLCELHVAFHLVYEPSSVSSSNINSRHPVIMGLRNILRTSSQSDVTTVTLPLLLTHEMSEEMTVQWCMKRAELVFKCVKGFMMEVASWGGNEIKTLEFLVPKDINHEVFSRLSSMLASIFRTSNPIREK